jgi:hypothetical protein
MESTGRERFIRGSVVAATESSECSASPQARAEHERPHEGGNLCFPAAFNHAEFLGVLIEELR